MSNKAAENSHKIGRGGVNGASGAIFVKGNPVSRRKTAAFQISLPALTES